MGNLCESIHKFGLLNIWSTTFGSKMQPRGICSGKILASWPTDNGQDVLQETFCLSAGTVHYYFRHSVKVGDEHLTHYFACVRWYLPHRESTSLYGNPVRVCENRLYPGGPSSFMPVQRIFSRFASAEFELEGQKHVAVTPIIRNVHL